MRGSAVLDQAEGYVFLYILYVYYSENVERLGKLEAKKLENLQVFTLEGFD